MGRIKTKLVKRKTFELLELYPNTFAPEFGGNKTLVTKYTTVSSRKLRNLIAGYLTRIVRSRQ